MWLLSLSLEIPLASLVTPVFFSLSFCLPDNTSKFSGSREKSKKIGFTLSRLIEPSSKSNWQRSKISRQKKQKEEDEEEREKANFPSNHLTRQRSSQWLDS